MRKEITDVNAYHVFVGSINCLRHKKGEKESLLKDERLSIIIPSQADFVSGKYMDIIKDTILNIHEEKKYSHFILQYGCQSYILSTDYSLLIEELKKENIELEIKSKCRLKERRGKHE